MNIQAKRKLLLVEDDPALSGYLASALRGWGYEVHLAADRGTAMAIQRGADVAELVLLDLGLPPQPSTMAEGLALLEECLRLQPGCKVIVLTGQDEDAAAFEAVRRGAFDFLVKPAALENIEVALKRAELFLRGEARLAQSGEARLQLTARLDEGPREAASSAEEQLLRRVLNATGFNMAETARRLGIAREHVYYYLNKYGIRRPE